MSASAAINAANAQFSTGPRSAEGKEHSKFNALKTGLFANTVVLPGEEQPAYEALGASLEARYQPQSETEHELVLTIQTSKWRLNRIVQLDFSLHAIGTMQHLEATREQFPDQSPNAQYTLAQAAAYLINAKAFDQLNRQEGRLQRLLDRAKRELATLISMRGLSPEPIPAQPMSVQPVPVQPIAPVPAATIPENGFVPSKYPKNMPAFSGPQAKEHRRLWLRKNAQKNIA